MGVHDGIEQGLQHLAAQSALARDATIFCASYLVFVMAGVWLVIAAISRARIDAAVVARLLILAALSYALSRAGGAVVSDPRPFIVEHIKPIVAIAHDNGFPSDHVLLAAALTASLWWIDRRLLPLFFGGLVLVALGRMGIAAHHLEDVVGSAVIVAIAAIVAALAPLPWSWQKRRL